MPFIDGLLPVLGTVARRSLSWVKATGFFYPGSAGAQRSALSRPTAGAPAHGLLLTLLFACLQASSTFSNERISARLAHARGVLTDRVHRLDSLSEGPRTCGTRTDSRPGISQLDSLPACMSEITVLQAATHGHASHFGSLAGPSFPVLAFATRSSAP